MHNHSSMIYHKSIISLLAFATTYMSFEQAHLAHNTQWNVQFDDKWDVLGPFPIHAREQHFLSPAFPLNLSQPINPGQSWSSSYADDGFVKWTQATSNPNGDLEISFPEIRWKALRSTEGWAALQHHAVLRTTVTLYPPTNLVSSNSPQLLVDLKRGSYFTLRPQNHDISSFVPEWCAGNIYDLERALVHVVDLPAAPLPNQPTKYDLFVSGDYEIRLFGDPLVQHHSDIPVQRLSLAIQVMDTRSLFVHHQTQDVACDFLAGYAFGDAFGIGIQSTAQWWTATDIKLKFPIPGMTLRLQTTVTIAPSQTRILPISVKQTIPYFGGDISVDITLVSTDSLHTISVTVPITHRQLSTPVRQPIKGTFFFANSTPSSFLAVPPRSSEHPKKAPPILALHGAGVDILDQDFWVQSLPDNKVSWMIVPTGRTSWGLDWHGPSAEDAWSSLEAAAVISRKKIHGFHKSWEIPLNSEVIIMGHSNGGQGTWYLASRHPDRALGAVPAAAYIKSQAYIPLTLSRNAHFIDPALRSILESSLTPDDNDLHISNLVNTPILAIHGQDGDDENVPVWHSREYISALKAWHPSANITFREHRGEGHWYPYVLNNPEVQEFLDHVVSLSNKESKSESFTLTVTIPRESGSLQGWRINKLLIPGRLARLHVRKIGDTRFEVETSNVHTFTIPARNEAFEIYVDDRILSIPITGNQAQVHRVKHGKWEFINPSEVLQSSGRMQSILFSPGPLKFVVSEHSNRQDLSVALRLAHVLHVYHKLDVEIIAEEIALTRNKLGMWPPGNIVFIGTPSSPFAQEVLGSEKTSIRIINFAPHIGERKFDKPGQALLFLHPHPTTNLTNPSFMMFLLYNDKAGLERATRLFPFRTGVAVPDWVAVGDKMDIFGAGGLEAAGVWDSDWRLSGHMSWFYS